MKTLLKSVTLVAALLIAVSLAAKPGDKGTSHTSRLPMTAQKMIEKNFKNTRVVHVDTKNSLVNKTYEVTFANGSKAKFDKNGDWTSVDCRQSAVPNSLVPKPISEYVKRNHRNAKITKIEKDKNKYNIGLSNGLGVCFDKNFAVTRIR